MKRRNNDINNNNNKRLQQQQQQQQTTSNNTDLGIIGKLVGYDIDPKDFKNWLETNRPEPETFDTIDDEREIQLQQKLPAVTQYKFQFKDHKLDYSFVVEESNNNIIKLISTTPNNNIPPLNIPIRLYNSLYPHQLDSIKWMWNLYQNNKQGGILADEMGLVPKNLIPNWEKESKKLNSLKWIVFEKSVYQRQLLKIRNHGGILISSNTYLNQSYENFTGEFDWDYVFFAYIDEAHTLGTPIINSVMELYSLFQCIMGEVGVVKLLGKRDNFFRKYQRSMSNDNTKNSTNSGRDPTTISHKVLDIVIWTKLTDQQIFLIKKVLPDWINGNKQSLERFKDTRGIPNSDKSKDISRIEMSNKIFILSFLCFQIHKQKDDRLVIFSDQLQLIEILKYHLSQMNKPKAIVMVIQGSTPMDERGKILQKFDDPNDHQFMVLIISKEIGSTVEPSYTILDDQAADRINRIGQTHEKIYIYRFIMAGTCEETMYRRQLLKSSLADTYCVDNTNSTTTTNSSIITNQTIGLFTRNQFSMSNFLNNDCLDKCRTRIELESIQQFKKSIDSEYIEHINYLKDSLVPYSVFGFTNHRTNWVNPIDNGVVYSDDDDGDGLEDEESNYFYDSNNDQLIAIPKSKPKDYL
eukprot:gene10229-12545_t